jgi:Fe-S cluster biogenesis protein NfuA
MDMPSIATAAEDLRQLVNGDGADLSLVRIDARAERVEFVLDLSAAGCGDCVLPPAALRDMVDATIKRSVPGTYTVLIEDPRVGGDLRATTFSASGADEVTIVSPAAAGRPHDPSPGPDAGDLRGKTVGFRIDRLWRSWDWVVDEWRQALAADGVKTEVWRRVQGLDGGAGDTQQQEYADFLGGVDAAVVGLGNCGSCTSWTIKDAVAGLGAELPTIGVTTAHFEQLGHTLAANYGRPGLRPEDEVRGVARDTYVGMLAMLGAEVS